MIFVLDNYDSFTYNLVHLLGEHTDDIVVERNDALTVEEVRALNPDGIVISPGPGRPADAGITEPIIEQMGATTPILGVCLGHQAMGEVFGATVVNAPSLMHGKTSEVTHDGQSIFEGVDAPFTATRYHSLILDRATIPDELTITATTDDIVMGVRHVEWPIEGIQFHPESVKTAAGPTLIANWMRQLAARSAA
ncbi:anthranilate/aminodeoxychorismate synthase component II [Longimonas halophila]|uniref:Anthranilate/aminodeoxychorismate synthase component II n=1 Tax=Longimonas halophila TaxID=1469170 RepID=A0A2H3NNB9_9BACT|nr:aminodeoxychorismate/anthranilate synthase component II [Longimonas halophila]PEN08029.1 anthranilate/aminodeoxychorismate synthase component II [Longimonas halophila]